MNSAKRPETAQRTVGPALEAMNGFLRWLIPTVEKFPRAQKFLLGDRIQSTAPDRLERLIEGERSTMTWQGVTDTSPKRLAELG
jgi:hypothetical protein